MICAVLRAVRRVLGCRVLGHVWFYRAETGTRDLWCDRRVCEIDGCERCEEWRGGQWVAAA